MKGYHFKDGQYPACCWVEFLLDVSVYIPYQMSSLILNFIYFITDWFQGWPELNQFGPVTPYRQTGSGFLGKRSQSDVNTEACCSCYWEHSWGVRRLLLGWPWSWRQPTKRWKQPGSLMKYGAMGSISTDKGCLISEFLVIRSQLIFHIVWMVSLLEVNSIPTDTEFANGKRSTCK